MNLFSENAERIVKEMNQVLVADNCPKDDRSVILLPDIMYLQTHETIGHALELDRILGYELAFAGGSFVTLDDFGKLRYGSEKLTARADATLPNSPGSFGYDDDGVPAKDIILIDKGILVGAITGRQMVEEANAKARKRIFMESGGANRASAFYKVPIERMTNINIDPGDDGTLDDIVADTEKGIILDGDHSWSIGSNREQFHFGEEIGWLVEDGEITDVVKNPTHKGDTVKFWNALSAVGDKSTWKVKYVDNCGKGQPNQIMQLGHGVPVCRFDNVRIGE
jgi:TldD protein